MSKGSGIDLTELLNPDLSFNDDASVDSRQADASGRTSEVDPDRLSTIDEVDEAPDWFNHEAWLTLTEEQKQTVREIENEGELEVEVDPQTLWATGQEEQNKY